MRALLWGAAAVLALASVAWSDEGDTRPPPGFLGVSMEERPIAGSNPARAEVGVGGVVPDSAAERAGLQPGDILVSLDGEDLSEAPGQVLLKFGAKIRGRGLGGKLRLVVRRWTVEIRTTTDGAEQSREAVIEREAPTILPDLLELLARFPEQLSGVQVRRYAREREVLVVLGARPGTRETALPPNETLTPWLARGPAGVEQRLARRLVGLGVAPITSAYQDLLTRFEADEGIEDPFRLNVVRFLHRDPLHLPDVTRRLGLELREAIRGPNPPLALLATATRALDTKSDVAPITSLVAPPPGSGADVHGAYLIAIQTEASRAAERAFSKLSAEERAHVVANLPEIALVFGEGKYLHSDDDRARYRRTQRTIKLLPKVDRGQLLAAQRILLRAVEPAYLARLEADLKAVEARGAFVGTQGVREATLWASGALCVIGSSQNNIYTKDFAVVVDLGGDDTYLSQVASARPDRQAALLIDFSGDDRYQSTVRFAQGSAFMGVALLLDRSGDDVYLSSEDFAQGAALAGAAICWDEAGDDTYRGQAYAQGAALCQGLGALIDGGGQDRCEAGVYSQAFAGPGAFGVLLAQGGDDRYSVSGRAPSGYGTSGAFRSMGQGASFGFRHLASGGVAVLCDVGGSDRYEAGNFAQGGGYYFAWGSLIDLGEGNDRYAGSRYAQGWAAHSALGGFWDEGGNDRYSTMIGASTSAAWDLCATVFLDDAGDDRYLGMANLCNGGAAQNGLALFFDRGGSDFYSLAPGKAGPNNYHQGHSLALFLDAGGAPDTYRYAGEFGNGRARVEGVAGVQIDTPGTLSALESLTDEGLRILLGFK
ncbi:MAG: PDZ domain-containing protein [Planctomycetes bacterium]|nr:PDZ domain-containing protein [Planctomycetota bacterium]